MNSEVHIETHLRKGITTLKTSFCTPPFKIADITGNRQNGLLQLVLMSSSPGILDGDNYHLRIAVGEGAKLQLETQSYQRLFTMKSGASQNMEVLMEKDASLCYLPHPVVPHRGANFSARNRIFLSAGCSLIWGEVFTCGRKLNGEIFEFTQYRCINEIFLSGKLVIRENVLINPQLINIKQLGQMEGYTHQATLICLDEKQPVKEVINQVTEQFVSRDDMEFGITAAPVNGFIMRLFGYKAEQLFDSLKWIAGALKH